MPSASSERVHHPQHPRARDASEAPGYAAPSCRWAVPIDNEHVTRHSAIVAWPLENGAAESEGWKPGAPIRLPNIRAGLGVGATTYEERQRKPDDLEAQEGQRTIACGTRSKT